MRIVKLAMLGALLILGGCASYTTPGGSVQLSSLAESDINLLMSKEPAAVFPANISVAYSSSRLFILSSKQFWYRSL